MSAEGDGPDKINFAIDRGGTFTDVFAWVEGENRFFTEKLLSVAPERYPDAPAEGIRRIISRLNGRDTDFSAIDPAVIGQIRMGTTVATNALLERKGARCALLISKGFGDLLEIGYQNRPSLFDLEIKKPSLLYEEVFEIDERIRPAGAGETGDVTGTDGSRLVIEKSPDKKALTEVLDRIKARGIDSIAVVFVHAHLYPGHEELVGNLAREAGFSRVSLSSKLNPQARIVRRGDTAVVDAYLSPLIRTCLDGFESRFERRLPSRSIFFMRSDGGLAAAEHFHGSHAILSGPAGGVTACAMTAFRHFNRPVIGFDMGGTSTDVCRYGGEYEITDETETAGVRIQTPQLLINTVAAGGGSRLFYRQGMFEVGPESAGADPGPACYRRGGPLAVTDANLVLGRLLPERFPAIFGPAADKPLSIKESVNKFKQLAETINSERRSAGQAAMGVDEIAAGFIEVANQAMARPIREISVARGHDLRDHVLVCFGGAGGQHACGIAASLGIETVYIHRLSGILSAYGLSRTALVEELRQPASGILNREKITELEPRLTLLEEEGRERLAAQGAKKVAAEHYLCLGYQGSDTRLMIKKPADGDYAAAFRKAYQDEFGFILKEKAIIVDAIRVRLEDSPPPPPVIRIAPGKKDPRPITLKSCFFAGGRVQTPVYDLADLGDGAEISGPALIIHDTSTVVIEPGATAGITPAGDLILTVPPREEKKGVTAVDPVRMAVFANLFMSVAEQMGRTLQRAAISTNIKERCDFSCAIFDATGNLVANAPHQPVHLGAMGEAVQSQIRIRPEGFSPGEVILANHPATGGSHLPDFTVITPVFAGEKPAFFVANRGHHADIGGMTPGSMPPFSKSLADEGVAIKSFTLVRDGIFAEDECRKLLAPARRIEDNLNDLTAQVAANQRGAELMTRMIGTCSLATVSAYMGHIRKNAEKASRDLLMRLAGRYGPELEAADRMDGGSEIRVKITIDPESGDTVIDFTGSGKAVRGNWNAPRAVTMSAILYVIRALIAEDIPLNQGCLAPMTVKIPPGSILDPPEEAAVAGGNVLTSQRIVDVMLKAFKAAAASQGCMNNLTIGNDDFGYYETIGGGVGAGPSWHGASGVHSHMTNTRITDPEILESRYPVILRRFSLRPGSGGRGKFSGGDGIVREFEFLEPMRVSILSERRDTAPFGMDGGENGRPGRNILKRDGLAKRLPGKCSIRVRPGDRIIIKTPGGGGWGQRRPGSSG